MKTFIGITGQLSRRLIGFWYGSPAGMNSEWAQQRYNELHRLVRSRLDAHPANCGCVHFDNTKMYFIDNCLVTLKPNSFTVDYQPE